MKTKLGQAGVSGFVMLVPVVASAAVVVVAPAGQSAPAIGWPMLAALAVMMVIAGLSVLQRRSRASIGALVVLTLAAFALGRSYANGDTIIIAGEDCQGAEYEYNEDATARDLESQCPNPVRITAISVECGDSLVLGRPDFIGLCTVGTILRTNESCELPTCENG